MSLSAAPVAPQRQSRIFAGRACPLLFGHRGASRFAPENTLPSFELADKLGADVLELDVRLSKDGEIVVLHDATLERTTNGHGDARLYTFRELAALDAGFHFRSPSGALVFRDRGVTLCRLVDVLDAFPNAALNIELKQREPEMIRPTLAVLERVGRGRVLLAAGDHTIMRALEATRPGVPLGMSGVQVTALLRDVYLGRRKLWPEPRALQIPPKHGPIPVATRRVIDAAHELGLEVHLWTINTVAEAERWLRLGVDGLMSDDPAALASLCSAWRRRLPPAPVVL